jgi:riboflavin synthase|tara:strand:+ start:750 stop:1334 length:585 start_codon:yes stop_codon:yes gene_type:complete
MFTGIIKKTGIVREIIFNKNEMQIGIKSSLKLSNNDLGSSINCSGACLTLEKIYNGLYYFHLSRETLKVSNFKNIKLNHIINLEKPLKFGDEISGHFVQGHVDAISKLKKSHICGKSCYLYFSINKSLKKFLNSKSSIAINGVSMTIAKTFANSFLIVVIPHTLKLTNLINIKNNDIVNIEIDIIAKYIKNLKK